MKILEKIKYPVRGFINMTAVGLSIAALVLLVYRGVKQGSVWHVVSFSIYGTSLIALWSTSFTYHSFHFSKSMTAILRQMDHAMIYFLIAGTYTPICLVVLRGPWGWSLFGAIWALTIAGIILKLIIRNPSPIIVAILFSFYIIMGWVVVIAWSPLVRALSAGGIFWLILGGVFYTVGAVFLGFKRLKIFPGFGAHEIWHLFVLAGSISHFWMMFEYISKLK